MLTRASIARRSYSQVARPLSVLNAFVSSAGDIAVDGPDVGRVDAGVRPLEGVSIAVKDNICTLDFPTTCGSLSLSNFQSPFEATVISKVKEAGGVIVGKTNMDEFGMGSHSVHSAFGPVHNPSSGILCSAGGSSGGSAVAVATNQCTGALGTDTGGSVRLPAAYCGVVGFKPSYGLISRWGVVAYANSLDTVGFFGKDVATIESLFAATNNFDAKDPTSLSPSSRVRLEALIARRSTSKTLRIGVPEQYNIKELSPVVKKTWSKTLQQLQRLGHIIQPVSLPATQSALSAYYILAPAEASSNLAKYDGVRYGSPGQVSDSVAGELFSTARSQGFGKEVQRRILLGAYSLSANAIDNYFVQAQKVRRIVQQDFDRVFSLSNVLHDEQSDDLASQTKVDCLLCPTAPTTAPKLEEVYAQTPLDAYATDVFTVPANLAGIPAISVPVKVDVFSATGRTSSKSVGMQIITQYGDDEAALSIARVMEEAGLLAVN